MFKKWRNRKQKALDELEKLYAEEFAEITERTEADDYELASEIQQDHDGENNDRSTQDNRSIQNDLTLYRQHRFSNKIDEDALKQGENKRDFPLCTDAWEEKLANKNQQDDEDSMDEIPMEISLDKSSKDVLDHSNEIKKREAEQEKELTERNAHSTRNQHHQQQLEIDRVHRLSKSKEEVKNVDRIKESKKELFLFLDRLEEELTSNSLDKMRENFDKEKDKDDRDFGMDMEI